jgi:hypothetical protein
MHDAIVSFFFPSKLHSIINCLLPIFGGFTGDTTSVPAECVQVLCNLQRTCTNTTGPEGVKNMTGDNTEVFISTLQGLFASL